MRVSLLSTTIAVRAGPERPREPPHRERNRTMSSRTDRWTATARAVALAFALVPLMLSRAAASQIQQPTIPALANGETVETIATEASDAATAAALGVTFAPPLAGAIGVNATSPRYTVTNF